MKHTITTSAQQEVALTSLTDSYNKQQKTTLTNAEFITLIALSPINDELSRLDENEVKEYASKFRNANKTKRDQVKAILP